MRLDVKSVRRPRGDVRTFRKRLTWQAKRFRRDDAGSLVIFSLFIFVAMALFCGLALDLIRYETARTKLQSTLDRAILAAASMSQELPAEDIVQGYFDAAKLGPFLGTVTVSETRGARQVQATAAADMRMHFTTFNGQRNITAPAAGTAREGISDVELSLVLDMSGSMNWNGKIQNLKVAGKDFIDTLFAQTEPDRTSVSIIPYATQVNAGAVLLGEYDASTEHAYSDCVDFEESDFGTTWLDYETALQRTGHFDPFYHYSRGRGPFLQVCRTGPDTEVLPLSGDPDQLKNKIDSLSARGNTSIDVGMKWGAALLDPGTRPVVSNLIDAGEVDPGFSGRPYNFTDPESMKIIVVMTDGVNTTQYMLHEDFREGPSGVWMDPATNQLYVADVESGDRDGDGIINELFYAPHNNRWYMPAELPAGTAELSFPELWATSTVSYNARIRYLANRDSSVYSAWDNEPLNSVASAEKDIRLGRICTAAKQQGVLVFAIGFEVTDYSAQVMENCASTPAHFFRVEGLDIAYAFEAIATHIRQLRLIQ